MSDRSGRVGAVVGLVFAVIFVAACAGVFWLSYTGELSELLPIGGQSQGTTSSQGEGSEPVEAALVPKQFSEYTWGEIAQVSGLISAAGSFEEARAVAAEYNILTAEGTITDAVHELVLADGTRCTARVVGVLADDLADGSGKAGLTLMAGPIASRSMNDADANVGGWEASNLRSWLASDGLALLPGEVSSSVKTVLKTTNNTGTSYEPVAGLTQTADALWVPSGSELYGTLTWFAQEYGDEPIANTGYLDMAPYDEAISSEGAQYQYFAERGLADREDPSGVLASAFGQLSGGFWTRSAYPVRIFETDEGMFYQVLSSGYPSTVLQASQANNVVVGFCI